MKIAENVKIYGLERIVFNKETVYELENKSNGFPGMWRRTESARNRKTDVGSIPHQQMSKNITNICRTKEYIVEFNGNTMHVSTKRVIPPFQITSIRIVDLNDCGCRKCNEIVDQIRRE